MFSSEVYDFALFKDDVSVTFEPALSELDQCGAFTYSVNYISGKTPNLLNEATVSSSKLTFGVLQDNLLLGSHLLSLSA